MEHTGSTRLKNLGAAEQNGILMSAIDIQVFGNIEELDGLFQERGRLAGKHGLVDDARSVDQENVSGDNGLSLATSWYRQNRCLPKAAQDSPTETRSPGNSLSV